MLVSPNGAGLELGDVGSGLVIFCVYDTVLLDSSEYTIVWLESSLESIAPWRGLRLAKLSVRHGLSVLVTIESKMSPFVGSVIKDWQKLSFLPGGMGA